MNRLLTVCCVVAATIAATSAAWAAIPGDGGVISACYTKVGGILRVIDLAKGQNCLGAFENPISWSQQGPKGDPGAPGDPGPQGAQGEPGAPGVSGYARVVQSFDPEPGTNLAFVECPAGTQPLGGGYLIGGGFDTTIYGSRPGADGWAVSFDDQDGEGEISVHAICGDVS